MSAERQFCAKLPAAVEVELLIIGMKREVERWLYDIKSGRSSKLIRNGRQKKVHKKESDRSWRRRQPRPLANKWIQFHR